MSGQSLAWQTRFMVRWDGVVTLYNAEAIQSDRAPNGGPAFREITANDVMAGLARVEESRIAPPELPPLENMYRPSGDVPGYVPPPRPVQMPPLEANRPTGISEGGLPGISAGVPDRPAAPAQADLISMTNADLIGLAQAQYGLKLSERMTKQQLIRAIEAARAAVENA